MGPGRASWLGTALALTACTGVSAGSPASQQLRGIDVSHFSGQVDWKQVAAAGMSFAFIKASEGVDLADPEFDAHWKASREAGLRRGAYHFYVVADDPEAQARFFISRVRLAPGDLPPVVDVETLGSGSPEGLAGKLGRYLQTVEAHYGVRPIVYTGPRFWDAHVGPGFADHPLWVAEAGVSAPQVPGSWKAWTFWQYHEDATVAGVEKDADLSYFRGSSAELEALATTGAPARGSNPQP